MKSTPFLITLGCLLGTAAQASDTVIHAGHLIDGATRSERSDMSVLIHDDRVTAIVPGFVAGPDGARIIDLSGQTVLPGLIDCHDHITASWHEGDPVRLAVTRSDEDDAIEATVSARNTLLAGFTSVRDVGGSTAVVVALRRAIGNGLVEGPRMWVAGTPLGPTGGHGDPANGLTAGLTAPGWSMSLIDGPDAARRAVRMLHRAGVDLIKIMPSGGVMSIDDDPTLQLMADDEIKAVVETAHSLGMKVAAHAHGKQAVDRSVALGVDSIEHGTYADKESYRLMKEHGTFLVPTMLVGEKVYDRARQHPEQLNPSTVSKALSVVPRMRRNLHDAYQAGVRIAFGTDTFGLSAHGENAQEFPLLVESGMSPLDAIWSATHEAADLLGQQQNIGSLTPGHYADVIAVSGDPLRDVSVLTHVDFVMKGGRVVKDKGRAQS